MKKILMFYDSNKDASFYTRMKNSFFKMNYEFIVITNKLSVLIKYRKMLKIQLLKKSSVEEACSKIFPNKLKETIEFLSNSMSEDSIMLFYNSLKKHLTEIIENDRIDLIFIWGMGSIHSLCLTEISNKHNINKVYFELSNIPGRIFVDPQGISNKSFIYSNINYLSNYKIDANQYLKWKSQYIDTKKKQIIPPQAKYSNRINNYFFIFDNIMSFFLKTPLNGERKIFKKIKEKILIKNAINSCEDKIDLNRIDYIFFPTQVSNDSQLLIHSSFDQFETIRFLSNKAIMEKRKLVIKIHPAELDYFFIKRIFSLKQKLDFYINQSSTYELICKSDKTYTINSTVGLEAKIFNKDVEFLSNNIFSLLNNGNIKRYILGYLVEFDYFDSKEMSNKIAEQIIERSRINN